MRVLRLEEVDSTNSFLLSHHPAEGEKMTVAVADYQTAGRGQGDNKWESERLLREIIKAFKYCYSLVENGDYTDVAALYHDSLYRKHGFHAYRDKDGEFEAAIVEVEDNGHLILRDHEDAMREYAFKEVRFIS